MVKNEHFIAVQEQNHKRHFGLNRKTNLARTNTEKVFPSSPRPARTIIVTDIAVENWKWKFDQGIAMNEWMKDGCPGPLKIEGKVNL